MGERQESDAEGPFMTKGTGFYPADEGESVKRFTKGIIFWVMKEKTEHFLEQDQFWSINQFQNQI